MVLFNDSLIEKTNLCITAFFDGYLSLRRKCPYSEIFWSTFSRIRTEYGEILCTSP